MRIFLIFLLLPFKLFSQDIEGVWTGTLYNDTTHKYIPYEIAISESKGKLTGYSHTIFIDENNRQETGVKSLKIKRRADKILIEDEELIYNNYTSPPPKGVRQYSTLNVMKGDSGLLLIGVFNTNRTREYASATGSIRLLKKNKILETKIITKLEEMKLANSLSFIQNKPKEEVAIVPANKITQTTLLKQEQKDVAKISLPDVKKQTVIPVNEDLNTDQPLIVFKQDTVEYKADVIKSKDIGIIEKPKKDETKNVAIKKQKQPDQPREKIVSVYEKIKKQPAEKEQKEVTRVIVKDEKKSQPLKPREKIVTTTVSITSKKPESVSQQKIINKENPNTLALIKKPVDSSLKKQKNNEAIVPTTKTIQNSVLTSASVISPIELAKRKIETIRTVEFRSDSLVLTLYDNGVVDGDTVSVLLNGKNIMPHQGLSTKAINKTIYITPDMGDSLQLIMYAENLGSIPPNTGLLIIHDGEEIYQIRFAGDLQKNAAIVLRRKKN
jgi:hypothetical protein